MLSPFRGRRGFYDPVSEMNRLFDNMLGGVMRRPAGQQRGEVTEWAPAIDVVTKDGDLVIRAELPGMKQEDVNITLQDNVLTVSGERRAEQEEERGGYYVRERRYGSFSRSLTVPAGGGEGKNHAPYEKGGFGGIVRGAGGVKEAKR